MYRIGIDIGKTFTALVAIDELGKVAVAKSPSTPEEPYKGLMEVLGVLANEMRLTLSDVLGQTATIVHGTSVVWDTPAVHGSTAGTNTLLEATSARVGLQTAEEHAQFDPAVKTYLSNLKGCLRDAGFNGELLIMHSHGGVKTIADTIKLPEGRGMSGKAGGIAGAQYAGQLLGETNLITFDMDEACTNISILQEGVPQFDSITGFDDSKVVLPGIDIHTVGTGGSSTARVDASGILRIGTESRTIPGPACYGRGGTEPTITDANVVLGYLGSENFLGSSTELYVAMAHKTMSEVADALGVDVVETAQGIQQVANTKLAEVIRLECVRRGVDPRNFALLSFGSAAGFHATAVARELNIKKVFVPRYPSVFSAWGMLTSGLRYEWVKPFSDSRSEDPEEAIRTLYTDIERQGRQSLLAHFDGPIEVKLSADMRFSGQLSATQVPLDGIDLNTVDFMAQMEQKFIEYHERLQPFSSPEQEVEVVNARVAVIGKLSPLPAEPLSASTSEAKPLSKRKAFLDGQCCEFEVYDMNQLLPGQHVEGPALVMSSTTTILLHSNEEACVTPQGWIGITLN